MVVEIVEGLRRKRGSVRFEGQTASSEYPLGGLARSLLLQAARDCLTESSDYGIRDRRAIEFSQLPRQGIGFFVSDLQSHRTDSAWVAGACVAGMYTSV
ncbi:hypothetical protein REJC140_00887 [Pseudorhizobium endolithicum]|uniref:Uncharacterized protein n=1 Tax=Pseudorhizobium endolithicum TaxID=1191678 RepID=A0ABM8PP63_9HYPH|nr:hypothetical protein REJC140_00887 [Pseudorhizobium endolithicum]